MTQNKNIPNNQQSGNRSGQQSKDGNSKEINPDNPIANKNTQKGSESNQLRPGSGNPQSSSGGQQRQRSPSTQGNQGKMGKKPRDTDEDSEEAEDQEIVPDEETSGKRKTENPDWSQRKTESPNVKKEKI